MSVGGCLLVVSVRRASRVIGDVVEENAVDGDVGGRVGGPFRPSVDVGFPG